MPRLPANEMRCANEMTCIDFQPAPHATVSRRTRCVSSNLPSPPTFRGGPRVGLERAPGSAWQGDIDLQMVPVSHSAQQRNDAPRSGRQGTAEHDGMRVVPNVPFGYFGR